MHGRVKVRTTEEERARKKKQDELVMRAYRATMAKIWQKREKGELDDELLQLTAPILMRNPDITTLWNLRREVLVCKTNEAQKQPEGADADALASIYESELSLTKQCLMKNPKSYYCWHQRCWILEQNPKANWQRELQLCNEYLKCDERNFHVWDHRRYAAERAGVPKQQELDFSTQQISKNFSNYSSWHQRSLLLPTLYPYVGDAQPKRPMCEAKLREELELVLSAAFTDPEDSSAWFYHRWLLGYSEAELNVCAFRCNEKRAVLAFTQPYENNATKLQVQLLAENQEILLTLDCWKAHNETNIDDTWYALLPTTAHSDNDNATVACTLEVQGKLLPLKRCNGGVYYFKPPNHQVTEYSSEVRTELQTQLDCCKSLLEFEPESKWALLTSALLMRAINAVDNHEQSLEYLKQLETVDALRVGYYQDLGSKWALEHALASWALTTDAPHTLSLLDVPQLRSMQYPQYLTIVDELKLPECLQRGDVRTFAELS